MNLDYLKKKIENVFYKEIKESQIKHKEWQKEQVDKDIISRKERMKALNGYDLRYTKKGFALLCAEYRSKNIEYSAFEDEVLIDCTDINNPKEFFTGLPLDAKSKIYLVNSDSDDGYACYCDWKTVDLVPNKLNNECPEVYTDYKWSRLVGIYSLEELAEKFGKYNNQLELELYKKNFLHWVSIMQHEYNTNNKNNIATKEGGEKVLKLGAKNNNNNKK